jgi:ribosome maturation factor RimP
MNELYSDIEKICKNENLILYDIESTKEKGENIFRIYITSKDGISIDDCTKISHLTSPLLDVHSPFNSEYRLEVSSPGIERVLKKPKHFKNSIGDKIEVKTIENEKIKGTLTKADDNQFCIQTKHDEICFEYSQIKKAKTCFEWK